MTMFLRLMVVTALAVSTGTVSPVSAQENAETPAETAPATVVERLHERLLSVMQDAESLGYQGRYEALAPIVDATFDVASVARFAVGRHWSDFSDTQRDAYQNVFRRITVGTYAKRFDGYSGQRFQCPETREMGEQRRLVRCELLQESESPVSLDYMLQATPSGWRIVNVYAGGVSDLAVKRQQYQHVIETQGIDALIDGLRERADKLGEKAG